MAIEFPGGEVSIPAPSRADLLLSAQQWVTRAREELQEADQFSMTERPSRHVRAIGGALDHVTRILRELEDAK